MDSRNLTGDLEWNTNFNISFNRNELTKLSLQKVYYYASTSEATVNEIRNKLEDELAKAHIEAKFAWDKGRQK